MKALTKVLVGGVAIAALAAAAPAAAQYYPGYGSPYGYGMPGMGGGYGYSPYGGYGVNTQVITSQCANAVQARLSGGYGGYGAYGGGYGYNGYSPYGGGYGAYGGGRVLGISRVEQGLAGLITVRGVASSGRFGGYAANSPVDLVWKCKADPRGAIVDIRIDQAERNYGYQYTPYVNNYSQYGYVRY